MVTVLGITSKTTKAEEALRFLEEKRYDFGEVSLIMREDKDIPENYFQKLGLINDIVGSAEGISPVAVLGLNESVYIAGPIAAMIGQNSGADSSVDPAQTMLGPLAGGFVNALMDIGVHEDNAKVYQDMLNKGDILIALTTTDEKDEEVIKFFEKEGVSNISVIAE